MANIPTNLKLINTGSAPTTTTLKKGEMAFGKVPTTGNTRLWVNDDDSTVKEITPVINGTNPSNINASTSQTISFTSGSNAFLVLRDGNLLGGSSPGVGKLQFGTITSGTVGISVNPSAFPYLTISCGSNTKIDLVDGVNRIQITADILTYPSPPVTGTVTSILAHSNIEPSEAIQHASKDQVNAFLGLNLTSTTEQLTGETWGGKPVYIKCVSGSPTLPSNAYTTISLGTNIHAWVDFIMSGYKDNTGKIYSFPTSPTPGDVWLEILDTGGTGRLHNDTTGPFTFAPFYVIFRYIYTS